MTDSVDGFFDNYGGRYVAEVLSRPLEELSVAFKKYMQDKDFLDELNVIRRDYIGRETPLYFGPTATKLLGGAQIYIKLEGLANTGAHKINNAIGQCLLAKRMGKKRIGSSGKYHFLIVRDLLCFGKESAVFRRTYSCCGKNIIFAVFCIRSRKEVQYFLVFAFFDSSHRRSGESAKSGVKMR